MHRDILRTTALTMLGIVSGWIGWSGHVLLLPAALVFPLLWASAGNRLTAISISAGYFLAASRGLPQGVAAFYASDLWPGILLWITASASFILVHGVLWTARSATRPIRYLLAATLMAVPPFGITGWAQPVTAAGVLFPGWGWLGLAAMTAGLTGLVSRFGPAVAVGLATLWLWSAASGTGASLPETLQGVDLKMGSSLGRDNRLERQLALFASVRNAEIAGAHVIVLPESTLGYWTATTQRFWEGKMAKGKATVLAGAAVVDPNGYDNVLVAIGPSGSEIVYLERMPVPGSMWQPWRSWFGAASGARAHLLGNSVADIAGVKIAPLICYEQLVVWPVLQSLLSRPDMIVAVGNGWWTAENSIVGIQRANSIAWACLFGLPLIMSFNL